MKDGLSQDDRKRRIQIVDSFKVVNNDMATLLRQVEEFAKVIRYYNLENQFDGYFDQFLDEIKEIRLSKEVKFDGNREPSQALLYTFIHHLHELTEQFNERWKDIPYWYLGKVLNVKEEDITPDHTFISFLKNIPDKIRIKKGTRFTWSKSDPNQIIYYHTQESISVNNISIDEIYSLYFGKNPDVFPANLLHSPTFLKIKDLRKVADSSNMLFEENEKSWQSSLGLCIASPALLLREGKRKVTLTFIPEGKSKNNFGLLRNVIHLKNKIGLEKNAGISNKEARDTILLQIFNNIFHLEISTEEGWTVIPKNMITRSEKGFYIQFQLEEDFLATQPCDIEIHKLKTKFPCLKILLNRDAWLFPYSWLKDFLLRSIYIWTNVEGISNLLFYNELGQVDISLPFTPFGTNTEKGTGFVIGNYEMAVKNISSIDVSISWTQLPVQYRGLYEYYKEYNNGIDNCSFQVQPRFLYDYKWRNNIENNIKYPLFSTISKNEEGNPEAQSELSDETHWKNIVFENMPSIFIDEEAYHYTSHSKDGFIGFILTGPDMGLGEKYYRQLFTESMIKNAYRKKDRPLPNPPISPLIRQISLSYRALDKIDLGINAGSANTILFHSYPFGYEQIYPNQSNMPLPFTYSMDTDANILIGLKNVKGNEYLNLYMKMNPRKTEVDLNELPLLVFYWGNGYYWERLPDESLVKNTTSNLITSGFLKIHIPEINNKKLFDKEGKIWLRIGITENEKYIPAIKNIYTNVVRVSKDNEQLELRRDESYILDSAEKRLPGITEIIQIAPFSAVRQKEKPTEKLIRISEYITHRGRAVTARDYERMALEAFPEIRKVKCLQGVCKYSDNGKQAGSVSLVIIPFCLTDEENKKPLSSPELLLKVEKFFSGRISPSVKKVDAINPCYEKITIRCEAELIHTNHSYATSRMAISKHLNNLIAPWRKEQDAPVFGCSLSYSEIYEQIKKMPQIGHLYNLTILQLVKKNEKYEIREYTQKADIIEPSRPYCVFIPSKEHLVIDKQLTSFGINEMKIDKDFVIWQSETEKL